MLAQAGVVDIRTPFAHQWAFRTIEDVHTGVMVDLPPRARVRSVRRFTGFWPEWRPIGNIAEAIEEWRDELRDGRAVAVTGDAFRMPWLPYYENEHMTHGFVVEGVGDGREPQIHVVDPYENVTHWGRAEPLATKIALGDLGHALDQGSWATLRSSGTREPIDPVREVLSNCEAIDGAHREGTVAAFLGAHQELTAEALKRLTLETWLLTRDRELHALWLADQGTPVEDFALAMAEDVVPKWRKLRELTYVAVRRAEAGRSVPATVTDALAAALDAEARTARTHLNADRIRRVTQ
ncbi:hypothetical protein AB0N89_21425 [Amycolatopsis sp. NPDC089917]|uniref:hypothetical protein n=1 Tax=Amycolatopsis sp. NPDC089917 TaxID=3155187 RepID=UPI003442A2B0